MDKGWSFGKIYSFDSKDYLQEMNVSDLASVNGVLAVLYTANSAPASVNATCPCTVFGRSRDQGKTFEYWILKGFTMPTAYPQDVPRLIKARRHFKFGCR
jgi:hypothetical protein